MLLLILEAFDALAVELDLTQRHLKDKVSRLLGGYARFLLSLDDLGLLNEFLAIGRYALNFPEKLDLDGLDRLLTM